MPRITFIQADGTSVTVEAEISKSVMRTAMEAGVPGILADCGGNCSCATCHGIIDPKWVDSLDEAGELEAGMLEFVMERTPTSRLTCQILVGAGLDGLVVHVPQSQT
jgi:2Fe-2S ferredoxin